ncbi:MAG: hypothetical protein ACC628_24710 [Pirellulaceae bacterium]
MAAESAVVQPAEITSLRAAIEDLQETFPTAYSHGDPYLKRLEELAAPTAHARHAFTVLQRDALLANPLLTRQPIVFVTRQQYAPDHHNTATIFQTGEINTRSFAGPGAVKIIDFAREGKVTTLLEVPHGVARDLEVSFDGQRILFSMRANKEDDYHLYEMARDGSQLRQVTFGAGVSDIDPLYLPDGRIVFTSSREPKYCMCNRHIMANLFRIDADGGNLDQIGRSTLFEGHGALLPDGRILYDRLEYVDRNFGDAQGLWTCNPDGTNHAIYWGNNTKSPGAVLEGRVLPGGNRLLAVFSSCHDRPWGALAMIDHRLGLDGKTPVLRTWPPHAIDLVMQGNYDTFKQVTPKYEDPYPLSDKYFLCSRQTGNGEQMGIYLIDRFGNELLVHSENPGCFDPMPLAPRSKPATIKDRAGRKGRTGKFYVHDVYIGTGMKQVPRGTIKSLRVVESPEKRFWSARNWTGAGAQAPGMNWHDFNNKRILGTVPVSEDGSAYFEVPADRFVYFQLLDEKGMMVQTMRSGTIVRPGETQGCVGCHENRHEAVSNDAKMALQPHPQRLTSWQGESRLFNYLEEVQPVFDQHCVSCHDYGKPEGEQLNLAGDAALIFNMSYAELWRKGQIHVIGGGPAEILPPYSWGSHKSKLIKVLQEDHYDVELDEESFDRIVTWIDINAPYYPSYASAYPDHLFGRSPLNPQQLAQLGQLVERDFKNQQHITEISLTRPERSPCLQRLRTQDPAKYEQALAIIQAGAQTLASRPRPDMPDFQLIGADADRNAKYEQLMQARE